MENVKEQNNIHLSEKLISSNQKENTILKSKETNNSRNSLTSLSIENSDIKKEEFEDNDKIEDNISYKEKQLSILLDVFEASYSKKSYKDLIKEIEEKENLLYYNSMMTFEIKVLKIKGLMKLLMEEYNNYLQSKVKTFHELDSFIHKIQNEFNIMKMLLINNSYVNEIITQIYCKFLFLLSKISLKREDYLKSLGFITLGINMLKVFIIKKKVASDIKTYKIYCKLLLELINILIGDKNFEDALFYIRLLFQIIEISLKFIYFNNKEKKQNISLQTIKKFIIFGGIAYIYTGCCLEQFDDSIQAFEAYKQARFFLKKGSRLGISFQNLNAVTINNSCDFLAENSFENFKLKFEKDKIERLNRQKKLEMLKKKQEYELLQNEKLMKLKFIANGMIGDPFKFEEFENRLNEKLFPSSIVNDLERLDDELMSFVFTYFKNKKNNISSYKDKISSNTKKLLSRYEVYNILMSKDFRDFIMKTKKLQFYNPKAGSRSISIIQRHLNNKMQIESNSKKRNSLKKKTIKIIKKNLDANERNLKSSINENFCTITTMANSRKDDIRNFENTFSKTCKKFRTRNNNLKSILSQNNACIDRESNKKIFPKSLHLTTAKSMVNTRIKFRLKKKFNELKCDFEKKNLDKNLMTKNYLRKYSYYDKLSNKELKFQKRLLYFKSNNTLYNKKRSVEEKDGIIGKDDIANISLIINENARVKPSVDENLIQLNLIKDSFTSKENKMSVKMKSAMSRVISKYINERRKRLTQVKIINSDEIKEINDKIILRFDYSIKNINNNIMNIKFLSGQNKFK